MDEYEGVNKQYYSRNLISIITKIPNSSSTSGTNPSNLSAITSDTSDVVNSTNYNCDSLEMKNTSESNTPAPVSTSPGGGSHGSGHDHDTSPPAISHAYCYFLSDSSGALELRRKPFLKLYARAIHVHV